MTWTHGQSVEGASRVAVTQIQVKQETRKSVEEAVAVSGQMTKPCFSCNEANLLALVTVADVNLLESCCL